MLTKILIDNFQRHEHIILPINPGTTFIRGPSDAGKSSIIRALKWLCFNRPQGSRFIRWGEDKARVGVEIDGHKIIRKKTKGKNVYVIDGRELKAIGTNVPEEVRNLLNLGPVNFQFQHDAPLWLTLTASQAGKELNKIVNLQVIDTSLDRIKSKVFSLRAEIKVREEFVQEATAEIKALAWVEKADQDLRVIEALANRIAERSDRIASTASILKERESIAQRLGIAVEARYCAAKMARIAEGIQVRQEAIEKTDKVLGALARNRKRLTVLTNERKKLCHILAEVKKCPTCQQPLVESDRG